jgi:hypothetical protein
LPLVALLLGFACAPAMEPVGYTPHSATVSAAPPSASASVPVWSRAASVKKFTRANARRFVSSGHLFGKYDADVYVNDVARTSYAGVAPGTNAPNGSLIVSVHVTRDGAPGPVFAMEKSASGWTFIDMDAEMHVLRTGRISPCVECHTHVASQDELFGVPSTGR